MSAGPPIIETKEITKIYGMGEVSVAALRSIDIHIQAGEFLAIMGPSGSGKSTLLHILVSVRHQRSVYLMGKVSHLDKVQLAGAQEIVCLSGLQLACAHHCAM
jgi:ABC-type lipoprotein export system ATPase subunit